MPPFGMQDYAAAGATTGSAPARKQSPLLTYNNQASLEEIIAVSKLLFRMACLAKR